MTIYVDEAKFPFRHQLYCHMATDGSIEELHQFAKKIGMKRSWFQNHSVHPHYDLSPKTRALALKNGAVEVTTIQMIHLCYKGKP